MAKNKYDKYLIQTVWKSGAHDTTDFSPTYVPKFTDAEKFAEAKIRMLLDEFYIPLSQEDIAYLRSFTTEGEINAAVRKMINKYWR